MEKLNDGMSRMGLGNIRTVPNSQGRGRGRQSSSTPGSEGRSGIPPEPLVNFFSFGAGEVPYIPPMPDRRKEFSNGNLNKRSGMTIVTPGTTLTLDQDRDKIYADAFKKEFHKEIQEKSKNPHPVEEHLSSSHSSVGRPGTSVFTGKDTSLMGSRRLDTASLPSDPVNPLEKIWDKFDMTTYKFENVQKLAVYKHKEMIMTSLKSQQVVIVEGYTGCGKTTQIPQYILNAAAESNKACNIVVTQPRRIAALSVAQRVCDERGWDLGSLVGYQVGLSRRASPDTRLCYMTTGILLQTLISRKRLDQYTHIIVDEVHERDLQTDLLLLVINKLMVNLTDKTTKIILMSATLNAMKFADYFPKWRGTVGAGIVRIPPDAVYPVCEYYLDTIPDLDPKDIYLDGFDEPKIHQECYDFALQIILSLDTVELNQRRSGSNRSRRGGVLIFLPGMMEIDTLYKVLREFAQKKCGGSEQNDTLKWLLLPLHSLISAEEQHKVFQRPQSGYRKIILATNIAESSITVTDITYVIDFCLTKSLSCDPATNYSCLRMEWASKNQCTQRKGRVGRVSDGFVYRMLPFKFYCALRDEAIPDMEMAALENVVLNVKNLDLGSPKSLLALSIDPPKLSGIHLAVANLKEVGALTITVNGHYKALDGDMTQMGLIMAKLPFDIRLSRLIVLGHVFGVLEESVIIAAGLSTKSPFSYPYHRRLLAYMSKVAWAGETYSDCFALLSLYRTWRQKCEAHHFRDMDEEKAWARMYFVQLNVMREIHTLIQDISKRLMHVDINVNQTALISDTLNSEQGLILKMVIAGAFYPNYFLRLRPVQKDYERALTRELSGFNPMCSLVFNGFPSDQPGQLYAENIAQHFMHNNSIPHIHFLSSKVILSNDPRSARIGLISQNVYKGIKMRQIREPISLLTLNTDMSQDVLRNELEKESRIQRLLCPEQVPLPSIQDETIEIVVTNFLDIENIWGVYKSKHHYLEQINQLLRKGYNELRLLSPRDFVPGVLCIAVEEGELFRARIDFYNGAEAFVYFIDYGKSIWQKPDKLFALNANLMKYDLHSLEQQAIQFRIYGVKPLARYSSLCGTEIANICKHYNDVFRNHFKAKIHSIVEGVVSCDLIGDDNVPTLRESLLEDRKVSVMEEPLPSKENNKARHRAKVMQLSEDEIRCYDERQISRNAPIVTVSAPTQDCEFEVTLKGPSSPLEMTFTSLCRSAHMKQVMIEGNSVNSVALDQEPMSGTARLLVAAGVAIAQRSGNVMAKDTTLMPAIPGLVGLLTMLFCPKLELRYSHRAMRYTGCVSGLGVDPSTNKPVYADHDVEIVFDTTFDNEDLDKINSIRMSMSLVLQKAPNCDIANLRASVRKELQELLEREREPVEELCPSQAHQWGLLKEDDLVVLGNRGSRGVCTDVFPLHLAVNPNKESDIILPEPVDPYNGGNCYDWDEDMD